MNKSFLKWAGGKSQSISLIKETIGEIKGKFIEPFVGSGVVFINIDSDRFIINDSNVDLINTFRCISNESFLDKLWYYFTEITNDESFYYEARKKFNETTSIEDKSLLFIYLNRHCFNGLCRYNKSGKFNVPFGKYKTVYFPEKEILLFKDKLKNCEVYCEDFKFMFDLAKTDDVIYCDPPYTPLSKTASFTSYGTNSFSEEDHIKLARCAEEAKCRVLISNHDTDFTRQLYSNADRIIKKEVSRSVSAKAESRKKANEILVVYEKGETHG
jgi:DNA adenine methylase